MVAEGLDRREVVALGAASVLGGCVCGPKGEVLPMPVMGFIDVHCHVFNAADVPAAGFIIHVAARELEFEDYKKVVALFVGLLAEGAPTPQMESAKLGGRSFLGPSPQPSLSDAEFEARILNALNALARNATVDMRPEGVSPALTVPDEPEVRLLQRHGIAVQPDDFRVAGRQANAKAVALDYLLRKYGNPALSVPSLRSGETASPDAHVFLPLQNGRALRALARSLANKAHGDSAIDMIERFLILARIFLDYRSANLCRLDRLFGVPSGTDARLYCPSTIDYDAWVIEPGFQKSLPRLLRTRRR